MMRRNDVILSFLLRNEKIAAEICRVILTQAHLKAEKIDRKIYYVSTE
jgi:hypothetical protein